ncbi:hypothetical protein ACIRG5_28430 [Lentzea sp. NPDC102401]|uniref:hypothetical protein n=1 Tax=Lentzea sp. NPDC102401 TaxID=3364128 RepID=UPI003813311F
MDEDHLHEAADPAMAVTLSKVFAMVEVWRERTHADAPVPLPGSSLAGDDRVTDPFRLSHAVVPALISAVDHFETLRLVIQEQQVLPARGGFTLLRAALENAAIAVWLLAPMNRNERVFRLLRLEWADAWDESQAMDLMGAAHERDKRKVELQALARDRGMSQERIAQVAARTVSWGEIVATAGDEAGNLTGMRAKWAWTVCSGLVHARRWAALGFLQRELSPGATDDLVNVKLSATEQQVAIMANIAAQMLAEGWRLFDQRSRSHLSI